MAVDGPIAISSQALTAPSRLVVVDGARLAIASDQTLWVAWCANERDGRSGSVRIVHLSPDGAALSSELIVALGARDGLALGDIVALSDGGAAVAWRGDEGLAWVASVSSRGRGVRTQFLDECVGAPVIATSASGVWVGTTRVDSGRATVQPLDASGPHEVILESTDPASIAAVCDVRGSPVALWHSCSELHVSNLRPSTSIALPSPRTKVHAPAFAAHGDRKAIAFIAEDTGKLSLHAGWTDGPPRRLADVWAPLERPHSSAPSVCARADGTLCLAWREERGPRAAVYLRRLDAHGAPIEAEIRVTDRARTASPGRFGLACGDSGFYVAVAEQSEAGDAVYLAHVTVA